MDVSKVIRLKEGERVLRVARNVWLTHLSSWLFAAALVVAAYFFMYTLFKMGPWGAGAFALLNAAAVWIALRTFMLWRWNVFVLTDQRVVDIDQRGFFSRTVSEAPFERIQDVSYAVKGVVGTICNFGSVSLQTAGGNANLDLPYVHDPKELHHLITGAMAERQQAAGGGGGSGGKVAALLEAAGQLDAVEARAFLTSLRQAMAGNGNVGRHTDERPDLEKDLEWYKDDTP